MEYADLPIIDLARYASPAERQALAQEARDAMSTHGFFYVINHGYSPEQVSMINWRRDEDDIKSSFEQTERIFDVADILFSKVGDEEKQIYAGTMKQTGSYQGYKLRQYWVSPIIY